MQQLKIGILIALIFSGGCLLGQKKDKSPAFEVYRQFWNATFLIKFQEKDPQIEYLVRTNKTDKLEEFILEQDQFRNEILSAFKQFPGEIGFFYTENFDAVKSGDYSAVKNENGMSMQVDQERPVFIIDPYKIESRNNTFNTDLTGFMMLDSKGERLPSPFPDYVIKRGKSIVDRTPIYSAVKRWRKKIVFFGKTHDLDSPLADNDN
ncbi:MAG: hypothetical protein ACPF8V_09175 [Luteibaculum sp.]